MGEGRNGFVVLDEHVLADVKRRIFASLIALRFVSAPEVLYKMEKAPKREEIYILAPNDQRARVRHDPNNQHNRRRFQNFARGSIYCATQSGKSFDRLLQPHLL